MQNDRSNLVASVFLTRSCVVLPIDIVVEIMTIAVIVARTIPGSFRGCVVLPISIVVITVPGSGRRCVVLPIAIVAITIPGSGRRGVVLPIAIVAITVPGSGRLSVVLPVRIIARTVPKSGGLIALGLWWPWAFVIKILLPHRSASVSVNLGRMIQSLLQLTYQLIDIAHFYMSSTLLVGLMRCRLGQTAVCILCRLGQTAFCILKVSSAPFFYLRELLLRSKAPPPHHSEVFAGHAAI